MEASAMTYEPQRCSRSSILFATKKRIKETWTQAKLLVWKNVLVFMRHRASSMMQFAVPFLLCVHMSLIQQVSNYVSTTQDVLEHPEVVIDFPSVAGCAKLMVGYTNGTTPLTDHVMTYIAQRYSLEEGIDLLAFPHLDYEGFQNELRLRCASAGVLFCTGETVLPYTNYTLPCGDISRLNAYVLLYNYTGASDVLILENSLTLKPDLAALATKLSVDAAIFDYYATQRDIEAPLLEAVIQEFPTTVFRLLNGLDVVALSGAFYFYMVPMVSFVLTLTEIVREKDHKLRQGLNVMGLRHSSYWLSWYITAAALNCLVANSTILAGSLFGYDFFLNTPYLVLFWVFFVFSFTMSVLAFCISTCVRSLISAYSVSSM